MFVHLLNERQQRALLALANRFVVTDQALSDSEKNVLELLYAESGLPFDTTLPEGETSELLSVFDGRQSKAALLMELIGIGVADDEFTLSESAFIWEASRALGISEAELNRLEDWVKRQLSLASEAASFWSD